MIVVANLQGLTCPWLGEEASPEHPRPVAESPIPSSQMSHLYSAGNAGGSRGGGNRCSTPTMADIPWLRHSNVARTAPTGRCIAYAPVTEEWHKLGGRYWWELRA